MRPPRWRLHAQTGGDGDGPRWFVVGRWGRRVAETYRRQTAELLVRWARLVPTLARELDYRLCQLEEVWSALQPRPGDDLASRHRRAIGVLLPLADMDFRSPALTEAQGGRKLQPDQTSLPMEDPVPAGLEDVREARYVGPLFPEVVNHPKTTKLDCAVHAYVASWNRRGLVCKAKQKTMAARLGCTPSGLKKSLRRLRELGFLRATYRSNPDGRQLANGYWALILETGVPAGTGEGSRTGTGEGSHCGTPYTSYRTTIPYAPNGASNGSLRDQRDPFRSDQNPATTGKGSSRYDWAPFWAVFRPTYGRLFRDPAGRPARYVGTPRDGQALKAFEKGGGDLDHLVRVAPLVMQALADKQLNVSVVAVINNLNMATQTKTIGHGFVTERPADPLPPTPEEEDFNRRLAEYERTHGRKVWEGMKGGRGSAGRQDDSGAGAASQAARGAGGEASDG